MGLATRLLLALFCTGLLVFGAATTAAVRRETAALRVATERELLALARSLQVSAENALRDSQNADIDETLHRMEAVAPEVDILVFNRDGRLQARSAGSRYEEVERARAVEPPSAGQIRAHWEPDRLIVALPLRDDDGTKLGAILVSRPTDALDAEVRATRRELIGAGVAFLIAAMAVTAALMRVSVARPAAQLMHAMRNAHREDVRAMLPADRADEIGEIARTFGELITQREAAQAALLNEAERRRELERGLEDADKLIRIGQLAAFVAHEVGSPLQVVHGRARRLIDKPDLPPDQIAHNARIIAEQSERVTQEIARLLDVVRRPAQRAAVDLGALCEALTGLLRGPARAAGVTLRCAPPAGLGPWTHADRSQLQQVLFNLARNAIQHSPPGHTVWVRTFTTDEYVGFEVEDQGPGVPPAVQDSLWEPLVTTRQEVGGSGLGLAIVRGIVLAHGGQVAHHPGPERGTVFQVRLPRGDAP